MSEPAADLARRTPDALDTPCVEWQGARTNAGYGHFGRGGRTWLVHRSVYEAIYGPIPDGLCVLHACDNPPCYNLDHLFLGTKGDNARDAVAKGRMLGWNVYKTHCKYGHEFTTENTLIYLKAGKPRRRCRACARRVATERRVLLPEPTSCTICGNALPPRKYRANPRKYCSQRCATTAYRQRKRTAHV